MQQLPLGTLVGRSTWWPGPSTQSGLSSNLFPYYTKPPGGLPWMCDLRKVQASLYSFMKWGLWQISEAENIRA